MKENPPTIGGNKHVNAGALSVSAPKFGTTMIPKLQLNWIIHYTYFPFYCI